MLDLVIQVLDEVIKETNKKGPLVVSRFQDMKTELENIKLSFPKIRKWENSVVECFHVLEQHITDLNRQAEITGKLELIEGDIVKLKNIISKVYQQNTVSKKWTEFGIEDKIIESRAMDHLLASFDCLESIQQKKCLLFLSIFPENAIIKKKPLIYWWMGEGLVTKTENKTAEEVGEQVFQELIKEGFINPIRKNKAPGINSCKVHPLIRQMLIWTAKKIDLFEFNSDWTIANCLGREFLLRDGMSVDEKENLRTVLNINNQYIRRLEWLPKLKRIEILQLGSWDSSAKHHIEVVDKEALNGLGSQKRLKYLSLRGISRIETFPPSKVKLDSLAILDLRACHNLERLQLGISSLSQLTHLDVSECYFLDSIPKEVRQISSLQVLKGFVIGKVGEGRPCKIRDLEKLKNLRKLTIRLGGESVEREELVSLGNFKNLKVLAISWRLASPDSQPNVDAFKSLNIPENLEKLDFFCFPLETPPEWLSPSKLPSNLKRLYIRGGKLNSLNHQESGHFKITILRLKYLKELMVERNELLERFPELLYLEKISCFGDQDIILNEAELLTVRKQLREIREKGH